MPVNAFNPRPLSRNILVHFPVLEQNAKGFIEQAHRTAQGVSLEVLEPGKPLNVSYGAMRWLVRRSPCEDSTRDETHLKVI